ncbi:MAG: hypothetical protein N7Q72_03140, partial [Spiroplasma sp. Tabriz.8]|nr:hypothetical protein [Spiroplasma sp. Tabriz.8]
LALFMLLSYWVVMKVSYLASFILFYFYFYFLLFLSLSLSLSLSLVSKLWIDLYLFLIDNVRWVFNF